MNYLNEHLRRLIILLLIVGCDKNSTEPINTCDDDVCEVKWLLSNFTPSNDETWIYFVDKCELCFGVDTLWVEEPYEQENSNGGIDTVYFTITGEYVYILEGDTLQNCMGHQKVTSILHYKSPNNSANYDNQLVTEEIAYGAGYFIIANEYGESSPINPEDYAVFRFEYK